MIESNTLIQLAVIIATKDRSRLLADRAIKSVLNQKRLPDKLLIVDESSEEVFELNSAHIAALAQSKISIIHISNHRTPGASGCWNSGIDQLCLSANQPENTVVAILDDDDSWSPDYLQVCANALLNLKLDMVACDFNRIESAEYKRTYVTAPTELHAQQFLTTNPGIQGSNLCVRLSCLLSAGCFDEYLPSTTDRDLCIRLADLGDVRYQRLPIAMMNHYADSDRPRLSSRGSEVKQQGLTRFWSKHSARMSFDQRASFKDRALALFNWIPPEDTSNQPNSSLKSKCSTKAQNITQKILNNDLEKVRKLNLKSTKNHKNLASYNQPSFGKIKLSNTTIPYSLHIGIISSEPETLSFLLKDLAWLQTQATIRSLKVLILDNGCTSGALDAVLLRKTLKGLSVHVVAIEQQQSDAKKHAFGQCYSNRPSKPVGIAQARTMLQKYLGGQLNNEPGSFGWILDDDMRLDARTPYYLSFLPAFRTLGVDVLIGAYEGCSPNPPLNGLRLQLVDLHHNLIWLNNLPDQSTLPDRSVENKQQRDKFPDYYYDLSRRHTAHLETPHWIVPKFAGETVLQARIRLLEAALDMLRGKSVTRRLIVETPSKPLDSAVDSVNRGGCTFILSPAALLQTPNPAVYFAQTEARRSDMLWAIINRYYRGLSIKQVDFAVKHISRENITHQINAQKTQAELIGSALYAALNEFLREHSNHSLNFTQDQVDQITCLAEQYRNDRLMRLKQSFYRIQGLTKSLQSIHGAKKLAHLISQLSGDIDLNLYNELQFGVYQFGQESVADWLHSLKTTTDNFASSCKAVHLIEPAQQETKQG